MSGWIVLLLAGSLTTGGTPMECERVVNPDGRSLEAIEETFHAWREAVETGDLDAVVGLVTEDAEFWSPEQPPLVGRDAVREAFSAALERWRWDQAFECRELIVAGGYALVRGVEVNRLEPRGGGDATVRRQRAFSVLREGEDGAWRFARGMTNAPPEG
ncbi:MAG TPA: SgcJ/EcaC family oxidoreductase [Longimicrobiales bacterium]|nr:SgcJ/EcaC family oxidoreductase [Longimicrobiales bacterium]